MWRGIEEKGPELDRQKEYYRQQERLRALVTNPNKPPMISADVMIEGLLKNKETFKKTSTNSPPGKTNVFNYEEFPSWLNPESCKVPTVYKTVWNIVQLPITSDIQLSDTKKVSQILLTSNLHTDVLGYIWNMANKTVPGQLTQFELYLVLALVALAQNGCTFNNISILNLIPSPPVPLLNWSILENSVAPLQTNLKQPETRVFLNELKKYDSHQFQSATSFKLSGSSTGVEADQIYKTSQNNIINTNVISSTNEMKIFKDVQIKPLEDKFVHKSVHIPKKIDGSSNNSVSKQNINYELSDFNIDPVIMTKNSTRASNFPCIGSSPTAELEADDEFTDFQSSTPKNKEPASVFPSNEVKSSNNSGFSSNFDEFSDFQSAILSDSIVTKDPLETVVISQKRDPSKLILPKLPHFKPKLAKISPESEKKLKCITPAEALSNLPESKISSDNKVLTMPNIAVLGGSREVGSRLANHSLESRDEKGKHCHRHHKNKLSPVIAPPVSIDELFNKSHTLLSSSLDELFPRCKNNNFILKETKIRNNGTSTIESSENISHEEQTRQIEIPCLGVISETSLPSQINTENLEKNQKSGVELMSIEEDKYSALREISLDSPQELFVSSEVNKESIDDFGDFLSADVPASKEIETETNDGSYVPSIETSAKKNSRKETETKFENIFVEQNETGRKKLSFDFMGTNELMESVTLESPSAQFNLNVDESKLTGKLHNTSIDFEFNSSKSLSPLNPTISLNCSNTPLSDDLFKTNNSNLELFTNFPEAFSSSHVLKDSNSTDEFNSNGVSTASGVKISFENNDLSVDWTAAQLKHDNLTSEDDFGDFIGSSDLQKTAELTLSRHSSLPSLDLKMSPGDEGMTQEQVGRKCLECCLSLLQDGVDIFRNVSSDEVLTEIFYTQEAKDYIKYLHIVYFISRRVSQNRQDLDGIQNDIEQIWHILEKYSASYDIQLECDPEVETNSKEVHECSVCCNAILFDPVHQGDLVYHPTCANMWVNCIEYTLPFPVS